MTVTVKTPYPLTWPASWPRSRTRGDAKFNRKVDTGKNYLETKPVTMAQARDRLDAELTRLGAKEILLSTNVELTLNGVPRGGASTPGDPGVACYFRLKGKDTVLACDRWFRVEDNIVALAKHIEAIRGMERWGVGTVEQVFTGYAALPAPMTRRHWTAVLAVGEHASIDEIHAAYRTAAKAAGLDQNKLLEANMARDEAIAARSLT